MDEATRIAQLIVGHLQGTLTAKKKEEFQAWLDASPRNRQLLQTHFDPERIADLLDGLAGMEALSYPIVKKTGMALVKKMGVTRKALAAAALVLVAIGGVILWQRAQGNHLTFSAYRPADLKQQLARMKKKVLQPTLLIADRFELNIDSLTETGAAPAGDWNILKTDAQHIVYRQGHNLRMDSPVINTLTLPDGKSNWQVTLPDGTEMDLDPGSSASFFLYPPGTTGNARRVILHGQAKFEVAHNPQSPFLVETEKEEMQVLGTLFIVRDYSKEDTSGIFVLRGSVSVNNGRKQENIDSGQRARIHPSSPAIQVSSITQLPENRAWQSEIFDFSKKTLPQAMKEIENWYGVKIAIEAGVDTVTPGKLSIGQIGRDVSLDDLLKALEKPDLHFVPFGKTILIKK